MATVEVDTQTTVEAMISSVSLWTLVAAGRAVEQSQYPFIAGLGYAVGAAAVLALTGLVYAYWLGSRFPIALASTVVTVAAVLAATGRAGDAAAAVAVYAVAVAAARASALVLQKHTRAAGVVGGLLAAALGITGDPEAMALSPAAAALGEMIAAAARIPALAARTRGW